jgi:3-phenylpropionate/trans-cinnamate dioxygenase ferredoxin reductase subunit
MPVIHADQTKCEGYGNCVIAAPDLVDLDEEGVVIVVNERFPESALVRAENAVRSCPVGALRVDR